MKSENPLLKEKEITRDYYLKRMLIWQQITGLVPSLLWLVISFILMILISVFIFNWDWDKGDSNKIVTFGAILFFLPLILAFSFATYYSTKFWKSHKEYQELANPTFNSEQQHVTN